MEGFKQDAEEKRKKGNITLTAKNIDQ